MPGQQAVPKERDQRADSATQGQGEKADQPIGDARVTDASQEQDEGGAACRSTANGAQRDGCVQH